MKKWNVWNTLLLLVLLALFVLLIKLIVGWNVAKWVLFGIIILAIISIMAQLTNPATCKKKRK